MVWVITKNWKIKRPSRKLNYQMAGLYKIISKIRNLYKVELLDSVKVYPVFLPDKLWKAAIDPLLGQVNPPLLPI
jgi:Trk K+ transport system NAD-binding subunit